MSKLAQINPHPRDPYLQFFEEEHIYVIKGFPDKPISVTTLVGMFWSGFDKEAISLGIVNSPKMKDPTYKYYGMTQKEILASWGDNTAAQDGTDLHNAIEFDYNDELTEYPNTKEFNMFLKFKADFKKTNPTYRPFRTEFGVFYEFYPRKLAGLLDMTFINSRNDIVIYDWKRVDKLDVCYKDKKGKYKMGKGPFSHMKDTKFNHYTMQLNTYRHVIESCYGYKVIAMFLAIFHPNNNTYVVRKVDRLENETIALFNELAKMEPVYYPADQVYK